MVDSLEALIEAARRIRQSPEDRERQRRSFVYGNTHFENGLITRDMVDREAEKLEAEQRRSSADE